MMRLYPGTPYGMTGSSCNDYDPRFRPWYVGATTGPKNLVLVFDSSGSMTNANRNVLAVGAAINVIDTLGASDWFGFVSFATTAKKY